MDELTSEEIERERGEELPPREMMSIVEPGPDMIGVPGPSPPVELPDDADEHGPFVRIQ